MEVRGYTENGSIDATIEGTRWVIPDDYDNRHRKIIADWESLGNKIPPYEKSAEENEENPHK